MKLYHYTSTFHLPMILQTGLSKGEVPLSPVKTENAVWFTTDPLAEEGAHGLAGSFVNKSEVQIAVDLPVDHPRLFKWTKYAKERKINPSWLQALHLVAGGNGIEKTWWIYKGSIPATRFDSISFRNSGANTFSPQGEKILESSSGLR